MSKPIFSFTEKEINRFWSKPILTANIDLCWEWTAGKDMDGYGKFKIFGSNYRAHRLSYFLFYKTDPGEYVVCHNCDNPKCVNPHHLFLGTSNDNIQDCIQKGRNAKGLKSGAYTCPESIHRGEKHGSSKLTDIQVKEILLSYNNSKETQAEIGKKYGVSTGVIWNIVNGYTWNHCMPDDMKIIKRKRPSKLKESDVSELKKSFREGLTFRQLSEKYKISFSQAYNIIKGKSWASVI